MFVYNKEELKEAGVLDIHSEEDLPDVQKRFKSAAKNQLDLKYVYAHV